jgi:ABC-type branched-chain amino acid transport systems, ATPase component
MSNIASETKTTVRDEKLLEVEHLSAWYGAAQVLFDMSFEVNRGEVVAIMGRNGAGKSTTFLSLMNLISRVRGAVRFRDHDIRDVPTFKIAQLGLGFVPEDRRVFTDLTVLENLDIGRQPRRAWGDGTLAKEWTIEEMFEMFPNLAERRNQLAGRLSGGEQQMLTVARTLMGHPYLILLDEPSEGVAPVIVEQMINLLLRLKEAGVSILLSEQNLHFAYQVSDRAYMLERGQIAYHGPMKELMNDQETIQKYLSVGAV